MSSSVVSVGCRAGGRWCVAALGLSVVPAATAAAAPSQDGCTSRTNNTYSKLLECVRLDGCRRPGRHTGHRRRQSRHPCGRNVRLHRQRRVRRANTLEAAGWTVTLDEFPFIFIPPPTLQQLTPVHAAYENGAFTGTGFGTVTGNVIPVDINLGPPRARRAVVSP